MVRARFRVVILLVATAAASVYGYGYQSSQANRPWPPDLQKVAAESPVLTPVEALKTFYMPPGYRIEVGLGNAQVANEAGHLDRP